MEKQKFVKKTFGSSGDEKVGNRKKGLSYVTVTSTDTKLLVIKQINENVKRGINEGLEIGYIPATPVPNVSFWVNSEENRCGMTITRENGKWGWTFDSDEKTWSPCKYLVGSGFDLLVFDEETNKLLADKFLDCCGTKPVSEQVRGFYTKK